MNRKIIYILKAQLEYIWYNFFATLIILVGIISYAYFKNMNPLNILCFILFVQYATLVALNNNKEKREYIFNMLTLSAQRLAQTRIILVLLGFIVIYSIALLYQIFFIESSNEFENSIQELFMLGGIGLAGVFLYLFISDYFTIYKNKSGYIWFNIISSVMIGILGFIVIISIRNVYEESIFSSTLIILLLYLSSFSFAVVSYKSYQKRESFLGV